MTIPVLSDPIKLRRPVKRGDQEITSVQIRTPDSGELRGVRLSELLATDYESMRTVLPRITVPTLHGTEIDKLDPADTVKIGAKVIGFLVPEEAKTDESPTS